MRRSHSARGWSMSSTWSFWSWLLLLNWKVWMPLVIRLSHRRSASGRRLCGEPTGAFLQSPRVIIARRFWRTAVPVTLAMRVPSAGWMPAKHRLPRSRRRGGRGSWLGRASTAECPGGQGRWCCGARWMRLGDVAFAVPGRRPTGRRRDADPGPLLGGRHRFARRRCRRSAFASRSAGAVGPQDVGDPEQVPASIARHGGGVDQWAVVRSASAVNCSLVTCSGLGAAASLAIAWAPMRCNGCGVSTREN